MNKDIEDNWWMCLYSHKSPWTKGNVEDLLLNREICSVCRAFVTGQVMWLVVHGLAENSGKCLYQFAEDIGNWIWRTASKQRQTET